MPGRANAGDDPQTRAEQGGGAEDPLRKFAEAVSPEGVISLRRCVRAARGRLFGFSAAACLAGW